MREKCHLEQEVLAGVTNEEQEKKHCHQFNFFFVETNGICRMYLIFQKGKSPTRSSRLHNTSLGKTIFLT